MKLLSIINIFILLSTVYCLNCSIRESIVENTGQYHGTNINQANEIYLTTKTLYVNVIFDSIIAENGDEESFAERNLKSAQMIVAFINTIARNFNIYLDFKLVNINKLNHDDNYRNTVASKSNYYYAHDGFEKGEEMKNKYADFDIAKYFSQFTWNYDNVINIIVNYDLEQYFCSNIYSVKNTLYLSNYIVKYIGKIKREFHCKTQIIQAIKNMLGITDVSSDYIQLCFAKLNDENIDINTPHIKCIHKTILFNRNYSTQAEYPPFNLEEYNRLNNLTLPVNFNKFPAYWGEFTSFYNGIKCRQCIRDQVSLDTCSHEPMCIKTPYAIQNKQYGIDFKLWNNIILFLIPQSDTSRMQQFKHIPQNISSFTLSNKPLYIKILLILPKTKDMTDEQILSYAQKTLELVRLKLAEQSTFDVNLIVIGYLILDDVYTYVDHVYYEFNNIQDICSNKYLHIRTDTDPMWFDSRYFEHRKKCNDNFHTTFNMLLIFDPKRKDSGEAFENICEESNKMRVFVGFNPDNISQEQLEYRKNIVTHELLAHILGCLSNIHYQSYYDFNPNNVLYLTFNYLYSTKTPIPFMIRSTTQIKYPEIYFNVENIHPSVQRFNQKVSNTNLWSNWAIFKTNEFVTIEKRTCLIGKCSGEYVKITYKKDIVDSKIITCEERYNQLINYSQNIQMPRFHYYYLPGHGIRIDDMKYIHLNTITSENLTDTQIQITDDCMMFCQINNDTSFYYDMFGKLIKVTNAKQFVAVGFYPDGYISKSSICIDGKRIQFNTSTYLI